MHILFKLKHKLNQFTYEKKNIMKKPNDIKNKINDIDKFLEKVIKEINK